MSAIFLSASVPIQGRGTYYETADPFLIQLAVRELVIAVIAKWKIVWGGHPSITPMVWSICEDLGVDYSESVILYQSAFFSGQFPEENERFHNVIVVEADGDRESSLARMRHEMLSRRDLQGAVFIGGMEGVEVEYKLFTDFHRTAPVLPVAATGGASLDLARLLHVSDETMSDVDFAEMYALYTRSLNNVVA